MVSEAHDFKGLRFLVAMVFIAWTAPGCVQRTGLTSRGHPASPASSSAIGEAIQAMHGIRAPEEEGDAERNNERLDAAWQTLREAGSAGREALVRAVEREIAQPSVDTFFLLDAAEFLALQDAASNGPVALRAIERLDADAPILRSNDNAVFALLHTLAGAHGAAVLPGIDRLALAHDLRVELPRHAMSLSPLQSATHLYGRIGVKAEDHLAAMLEADHAKSTRILEILNFIGSPRSMTVVSRHLARRPNVPTLDSCPRLFPARRGA